MATTDKKRSTPSESKTYYAKAGFDAPDYGEFKIGQEVPAELAEILIKRKSGYITDKKPEKQKESEKK